MTVGNGGREASVSSGGVGVMTGGTGERVTSVAGGTGGPIGGAGERVTSPTGGTGERGTRGFAPNGFSTTVESRSRACEVLARGSSDSISLGFATLFLGTDVISSHAHFTSLH